MDDLSKQNIHGYELQEQIGAGGFGAVYRAYQPLLKREVAIKVILPEYANSPDFIRRFEIEAELVARLEHPHIVPLFDYWRELDSAYLVMRLLRGGDLKGAIYDSDTPLSLEHIASILDQIAAALHIAHRNGVVHRDIKPGNILLDEDDNAYLTDFGIAQSDDAESLKEQQEDAGISGSIAYTPPEQLQGGQILPQTDIYALGIVLYEMLAGEHPFGAATITQLIFKQLSDPLPELERDDLSSEINDILQKATAKTAEDRYDDVRDLASDFRSLLIGDAGSFLIEDETAYVDLPNPYKGLRAFQEADADQFFGRELLVERLLNRLNETTQDARFLAVIGASGSGKSSVVKAGLLPALRRGGLDDSENWFIVEMFPGISPFSELEAALKRVAINPIENLIQQVEEENGLARVLKQILPDDGSELLLVIDQFEELFTQVEDEDVRSAFLDNLLNSLQIADSRLRVIVTMRADFYDRPLQYREFGELLRKRIETVLPMSADELFDTITRPSDMVGATFQMGLVEAISNDVGEQAGMLPLLQYTMTELFDHREGRMLTLGAYQEIGGVAGSLARRSEELYSGLDDASKQAVRQLFLRLVSLGEGTENTRRRVRRSEVATSDAIASVIQLYGRYRLLTFDKDPESREPTVEVAHEALIRTWERLREWIEDSYEDLRVQHRVAAAVAEWLTSRKDPSFLASGARLTQFQEWREQTQLILNDDEQTYITTSINAQAEQKAQELAIARRVQNFQRASIGLAVMVVLAVAATGIFLNQANQAQQQVNEANETLTPAQATVVYAQTQAQDAQEAVDIAQAAVNEAQAQIEAVGETLTPIQATVAAGDAQLATRQADLATAQALAGNAQTQVAVVQELTSIAPTLAAVDERVANLEAEVENVGATLTPAQATVNAAQEQVIAARETVDSVQVEVEVAQTQIEAVGSTLTPAQATVNAAQGQVVAARETVDSVQAEVEIAQTQIEAVGETLTPAQATVNAAQEQVIAARETIDSAQIEVEVAQAQVESVGETLTPVALTVVAGEEQLTTQQADLATAQALAGNAQTQAAVVQELTIIAPILASADERVANLEAEVENVGATIDAAQAQINSVGLTLTPIQEEIIRAQEAAAAAQAQAENVQREADSISLAINAEQAITVGNYDLALALTFESLGLNPEQTRARRILNDIAFGTARLSFSNAPVAELSKNGRYFVVAEGNDLFVWDVQTRTLIDNLTGHLGPILSVDFDPTGRLLATGSTDGKVFLWDISGWQNGEAAQLDLELAEHSGAVNVVRFGLDPNLPSVFSASDDTTIIRWATSNGSIIQRYTGNSWPVVDLDFVGTGTSFFTIVNANQTPILLYWNLGNSNPTFTEQNTIYQIYNDDATRAIIGGTNGRPVEVFNTTRRSVERSFTGRDFNWPTETATAYALRPGGREAAIGINSSQAENRLVSVDIATGAIIRTFSGEDAERVDALAFNPDGSLLLSAYENRLILWDTETGTAIRTLAAHTDIISEINWSADGRFAVSRSRDNNVRLWDITGADEALRQIFTIETAVNRGKFPGFNSRGDQVYTGVWISMFSWNLQTGVRNDTVSIGDEVINIIYSPIQSQAITILENVAILWNLDAGINGLMRRYGDGSEQFTGSAAYSPNGEFMALDERTRIIVYDMESSARNTINKPPLENGHVVTSIAVSPEGRFVVAATGLMHEQEAAAGNMILWDAESGQVVYHFPSEHIRTVNSVTFSADGTQILSASDDNTLILWDLQDNMAIVRRRFAGHKDDVNVGLFVTNDNQPEQFVLSASDDHTIILWDIESGQALRTFQGSPAAITGLAISPDGRQMVTSYGRLDLSREDPDDGSPETLIFVWEITHTEDLIAWSKANRFIRPLSPAECGQYGIENCNNTEQVSTIIEPAPTLIAAATTDTSNNTETTNEVAPTATPSASDAQVINSGAQGLNVRSSDSTNASVVTTLQSNETAEILGRSTRDTRWYQIRLNDGRIGWVRQDVVSVQGDVSNLPDLDPPPIVQAPPAAPTSDSSTQTESNTEASSSQAQGNLQITGIGLDPSPPRCLQTFNVLINIQNTGSEATIAGGSVLIIDRHLGTGSEQGRGTGAFPALASGENWLVAVPITISTFFGEQHEIVIQIDSTGLVSETNEGDNFSTTTYVLDTGSC